MWTSANEDNIPSLLQPAQRPSMALHLPERHAATGRFLLI